MAYTTLQEMRDEGITEAQASDARLTMLILLAGQYIDRITRRWFEPRTLTLSLDGPGHDTIWPPAPIIELTEVKVEGTIVPFTGLTIYNRRVPDDRDFPQIIRKNWSFPKGRQNIEITGSFGYTDEVGGVPVTPALITQAAKMLVIRELPGLGDQMGQEEKRRARIISETTDRHSYTLAQLASSGEYTGDPEIDNILYFYTKPPGVSTV